MFGKKNKNLGAQFDSSSGKRVMSDIVKTESRAKPQSLPEIKKQPPRPEFEKKSRPSPQKHRLPRLLAASSVLGLSLFIGFILLRIFSQVAVRVTPKEESRPIDLALPANIKGTNGSIPLEIMNFTETLQKSGKATGIKNVSQKASGVIAIFNTFSSQPQTLVKNTRFETPQGKIYRIDKSTTIPGAKIANGKIEPSSVEATVYADEPGENYNGPPADFTIPGFKGTPKYEKFFGRSKTPLDGGFIGRATIVTENDVTPLKIAGQNELKDRIAKRREQEKPQGFLMPDGAFEIKLGSEDIKPAVGEKGDEFRISLGGSFSGILLRPNDIISAIIKKSLANENPTAIKIVNFDKLALKATSVDFKNGQALIKVSGQAHFVWEFDENKLRSDLLVASSADREKVFAAQASIQRAEIIFKPSWWRIFPSNPSKIKVEEIISE